MELLKRGPTWLVLVVALALASWLLGWWALPILGALWGLARRNARHPWLSAGLAAAAGWTAVLLARGSPLETAELLGGVFAVPGAAMILVTLLFPFLLAASAAGLAATLREATHRTDATPRSSG